MNYMPPPWWGYPPPPEHKKSKEGITRRDVDRAVKQAIRLLGQEKFHKRRRREELMKKAAAGRARLMNSIEIFILGVVCYPIIGPLYNMVIHYVTR